MSCKSLYFVVLICVFVGAAFSATYYNAIPISSPNGVGARALNNLGQVTGDIKVNNYDAHAFLWDSTHGFTDLGAFPTYNYSQGFGINDNGYVTGSCYSVGTVWKGPNQYVTMGSVTWPRDINNKGMVTGYSRLKSPYNAFIWQEGKELVPLGSLGGGSYYSHGESINEKGQIVGNSEIVGYNLRAFFWEDSNGNWKSDPGEMINLGALVSNSRASSASDITDNGLIVGVCVMGSELNSNSHAFWTTKDAGRLWDLGTLGGTSSAANAANNLGQIVGYSYDENGQSCAFLCGTTAGSMIDLNDFILTEDVILKSAYDINEYGQILAASNNTYYLLNPVPEPATSLLLLAGMIGLMRNRRS